MVLRFTLEINLSRFARITKGKILLWFDWVWIGRKKNLLAGFVWIEVMVLHRRSWNMRFAVSSEVNHSSFSILQQSLNFYNTSCLHNLNSIMKIHCIMELFINIVAIPNTRVAGKFCRSGCRRWHSESFKRHRPAKRTTAESKVHKMKTNVVPQKEKSKHCVKMSNIKGKHQSKKLWKYALNGEHAK